MRWTSSTRWASPSWAESSGKPRARIRVLIALLAAGAFAPVCFAAQDMPCTNAEAAQARKAVSDMRTWAAIHKAFRLFQHCDRGRIRKSFSESVVRMLAARWDQLPRLWRLTVVYPEFKPFVLDHIDAAAGEGDLMTVVSNANYRCPDRAAPLCDGIATAAADALEDIRPRKLSLGE